MSTVQLWWITLGGGLVVVAAVWALLYVILALARRTTGTLSEVWIVGQAVANNTAHLDLIRRSAVQAEEAVASLDLAAQHARRLGELPGP